jgi:phosphotransferase system IIB component
MNELKKITKKEILFKDNFLSYTKSMLHLPIFTVSTDISSDDLYVLKIDKMEGFKSIELNFPRLSIKNDFMTFSFILKLFYENCEKEKENPLLIDFNLNDYFDFFKVARSNRSSYSKSITNCIKRLSFVRNDKTYICNFLSSATIDNRSKRQFSLSLGENFLNFFKHDTDLIFNINLDACRLLNKEFSIILYLYYITNLHKIGKDNVASFDRDLIFTRLQSESADRRKLQLIREANQELIDKGQQNHKNKYQVFIKEKRRNNSRRN